MVLVPRIKKLVLIVALISLAFAAPVDATPRSQAAEADGRMVGNGPTCNGRPVTIFGTDGDDTIIGTRGRDVILAGAGDDIIYARKGHDTICAGDGEDIVFAGAGRDWISGEAGYDILKGGRGNDIADDYDAQCFAETNTGCLRVLPEHLLPSCDEAPVWVVQAIYVGFGDTPHVCYFADYISYRESRWDNTIIGGPNRNGTYDYGLLQLNSGYIRTWAEWAGLDWNDWDDPIVNAQIARAAYDGANRIWGDPLRPWSATR